jgi:hypothetical protein
MTKEQKELLKKCKEVRLNTNVPLLDEILVIPTYKLHDSGYRKMVVIGVAYLGDKREYYLLDNFADVIDIDGTLIDYHMDISKGGIIRYWSRYAKFKNIARVSNCIFKVYYGDGKE